MINRINLILRAKNISARQFAEEIGIQPSGMSHIMSGRNNPSLDFVTKVIRRYPEIDANWLLLGKGEMYATHESGVPEWSAPTPEPMTSEQVQPIEPTLFTDEIEAEPPRPLQTMREPEQPVAEYAPEEALLPPAPQSVQPTEPSRLERILFFYSDRTFSEYRPR